MDIQDAAGRAIVQQENPPRTSHQACVSHVERGEFLQVGTETYLVYGSDEGGWSIGGREADSFAPPAFRYDTLDELFFALVNFTVSSEGTA